jgi:hypothetical protein
MVGDGAARAGDGLADRAQLIDAIDQRPLHGVVFALRQIAAGRDVGGSAFPAERLAAPALTGC